MLADGQNPESQQVEKQRHIQALETLLVVNNHALLLYALQTPRTNSGRHSGFHKLKKVMYNEVMQLQGSTIAQRTS